MTTLVVGASGTTGKHLVNQLLEMGNKVKVVVRPTAKIPDSWKSNRAVFLIEANVLEISESEMAEHIKECNAVASCLGHNMSWKGIYREPKKLVTDAILLLSNAIKKNKPDKPVKIVLMSTTAYINSDLDEPNTIVQKIVIGLLRLLLPPHVDNENAADFLWTEIDHKENFIEWVAVRPYGLINEDKVTEYEVHSSPTKPAIFDPGKTRRINVGHFMAKLITDNDIWSMWKGQMPVIRDKIAQENN